MPPFSVCVALGRPLMFSSVQFSRSVMSDSLWPHESQHARPPCPSPTPGVHSNSCPSSQWCHPAISSSVVPFSSFPQSLPASESFPMSQLFASGGQSTGVSASASVLPMNTQDWSPLEWTGWISLQSRDSQANLKHSSDYLSSSWLQRRYKLLYEFVFLDPATTLGKEKIQMWGYRLIWSLGRDDPITRNKNWGGGFSSEYVRTSLNPPRCPSLCILGKLFSKHLSYILTIDDLFLCLHLPKKLYLNCMFMPQIYDNPYASVINKCLLNTFILYRILSSGLSNSSTI